MSDLNRATDPSRVGLVRIWSNLLKQFKADKGDRGDMLEGLRFRSAAWVLVVFSVVVAGCSSTGPEAAPVTGESAGVDDAAGIQTDADEDDQEDTDQADQGDSGADTTEVLADQSPLQKLINATVGSSDADEQAFQDRIAECMAAEGFEYIPYVVPDDALLELTSSEPFSERAKTYGLKATTTYFPQALLDSRLIGSPEEWFKSVEEDPNTAIVEGLAPEERRLYYVYFYGSAVAQGYSGSEVAGCSPTAYAEEIADFTAFNEAFNETINEELVELEVRALTDPRVLQANEDLASCITGEGFEYANFEEANSDLQLRLFDLMDEFGVESVTPETSGVATEVTMSEEAIVELAALQAEELVVANGFVECGYEELQLLERQVYLELEQDYVDANGLRIAELLAEQ